MAVITRTITGIQKVAKAVYAGAAQVIAGLILVTIDGGGLAEVSTNEWLVIVGATLAAAGGVYGLTNKPS